MEKRLPLALFLSFLVLFGWTFFFAKKKPLPESRPGETVAAREGGPQPALRAPEPPAPAAVADDLERELELLVSPPAGKLGTHRALFSNRGARLLSLDLGDFVRRTGLSEAERADPSNWLPLLESIRTPSGPTGSLEWRTSESSRELAPEDLGRVLWQMEELPADEHGVLFRYSPPGGKVLFEKRVQFEPGTWRIRVSLALENRDAGPGGRRDFVLVVAAGVPSELGEGFYKEPRAVAIGRDRRSQKRALDQAVAPGLDRPGALEVPSPLVLAGEHNKYFALLMREVDPELCSMLEGRYAPLVDVGAEPRPWIGLEVPLALSLPPPGERRAFDYLIYAGPKDPASFVGDFPEHQLVLDEDLSVATVAKALLHVLRFFHGLVGNWGVAIILLTLCVRVALFPLNRRAQTAMARYTQKMKRVQPKLEEIKARHAGDPQKLREAQARLMQEEGAFPPLGGCLPIFLQMPIFLGLFSALRTSFDLRQAPFLGWIDDLSRPDRLLELGLRLPVLPDVPYLNLLPILMVVLWLLQQRGMPKPADEQAARMQKMMMFMPVIFGVTLYNYAAGLSLYMITTSALSIVEQKVIRKLWPIDDREPERKASRGCGPFSGMLRHMAERQREQMLRMQALKQEHRSQSSKQVRRKKRK